MTAFEKWIKDNKERLRKQYEAEKSLKKSLKLMNMVEDVYNKTIIKSNLLKSCLNIDTVWYDGCKSIIIESITQYSDMMIDHIFQESRLRIALMSFMITTEGLAVYSNTEQSLYSRKLLGYIHKKADIEKYLCLAYNYAKDHEDPADRSNLKKEAIELAEKQRKSR